MLQKGMTVRIVRERAKQLPAEKRTCVCGNIFIRDNFCFVSTTDNAIVCPKCCRHHNITKLLGEK